ncbi:UNVERIFIED_CONTAM: hypothetical protein K2H54_039579 [Gekko kuhli]
MMPLRDMEPTGKSVALSLKRSRMAAKEKLEAMLNVALRVPSIMLLDVLYRWDVSSFFQQIQRSSLNNNPLFQYKYLALNMHYVEHMYFMIVAFFGKYSWSDRIPSLIHLQEEVKVCSENSSLVLAFSSGLGNTGCY